MRGKGIAPTLRPRRWVVQHLSVAALLALTLATAAPAATLVTFVSVQSGDALTLSNPQASTVTGQFRLVPDVGAAAPAPVPFSIPAQGTQAFPNAVASFGPVSAPAILAVESSDAVHVSGAPLRVAYPERPLTLPVRFDPSAPGTGALALGILNASVRVNVYEHATSVTPLVSRTFSAAGEQVTRLRYADILPSGVSISDGHATITPLSGEAVGTSVNAPVRRRAVGTAPPSPPILSVAGGPACEFSTGVHASVPSTAGATYHWTLLNATAQGALTSNALDVALGSQGYAAIGIETTVNGSVTTVEANVRIDSKPVYTGSSAASVTLGQDGTITWTLVGSTPTSQTLSGTDFTSANLASTATSYTYHPTAAGPKSYALNATNGCGSGTASGSYTVSAVCTAPHIDSFTSSGSVCVGSSAQLTWASSGSGTVTIDGGVGAVPASGSVLVSPSSTTTYTITKTASCGADTATTTVTLTPKPTATVSGGGVICPGGSVQVSAALTGAAPWSVQWSDGVTQSGVVSSLSSRSVSPSGTTTYTVTSVTDASCTGTSSGSALVTVTPTPAAPTFGTSGPVCAGSVGNSITVSNLGGGNALTSASCSNGCTVTNVTGATITYTAGATGPIVLSAKQQTAGGCTSPVGSSGNVTVNPNPATPTITAPSTLTGNSAGNVASVPTQGGATYSWSITNGTITAGAGSSSITFTSGPNGNVVLNVTVTTAAGCTASNSKSIPVNCIPSDATITAAASVCASSTGSSASVANPGAGSTFAWTATGGSITSGQGTSSIQYTAGASGTVQLGITLVNPSSCQSTASKSVTINPVPASTITAAASVCASSTGNVASVANPGAGSTFAWTATGGSITSGQGTPSIQYTAGASGTVQLGITLVNPSSCQSTASKSVTIDPVADATITASGPTTFCQGGSVTLTSSAGTSYLWAPGGATTQSIVASTSGSYTVTVTNASGCSTTSAPTVVTVNPLPSATITAAASVCANSTLNNATIASPGAGATIVWSVTNGLLTGADFTNTQIIYRAGASGTTQLNVTVTNGGGCSANGSKSVTLNAAPDATITTPSSTCASSTGNTATIPNPGGGATITWSVTNGSITGGQGTTSVAFTAGASGTTQVGVTVTNATSCSSVRSANVSINPLPVAVSVSASPNNFSTPGPTTITFTCNNCTSVNIVTIPSGQYGTPTQLNATTWQMSWSDTQGPNPYTIHATGTNSCGTSPEVTNTFVETF